MILEIRVQGMELTVDFGEVKTAPTERKEKGFQIMLSAYFHYSKAPQNVFMSSCMRTWQIRIYMVLLYFFSQYLYT